MTRRIANGLVVALALTLTASPAVAGWKNLVDQAGKALGGGGGSTAAVTVLSNDDVIAGLKEALAQGAEKAVASLGRADGFLGNAAVKIPLPENLRKIGELLRKFGQGRYADEFVTTMNRAAESAVPEAGPILGDAIRGLSVEEGRKILDGPDDAATQYFRKVGGKRLAERLLPIVKDATDRNGVTSSFKRMNDAAGPAARLVGTQPADIDQYVTDKALDGLFSVVAAEEKRIRENPLARSTDLLKKVFGSTAR